VEAHLKKRNKIINRNLYLLNFFLAKLEYNYSKRTGEFYIVIASDSEAISIPFTNLLGDCFVVPSFGRGLLAMTVHGCIYINSFVFKFCILLF
jgi:hypothetical protein